MINCGSKLELFSCPCSCGCGGDAPCLEGRTFKRSVELRSRLTIDDARVEAGIPSADVADTTFGFWLLAAKQSADRFLANDFCGEAIPEPVEQGLLAFLRAMYEDAGADGDASGEGGGPEVSGLVASQSVGGVSMSYRARAEASGSGARGGQGLALAIEAGRQWWEPYRALWGFGGFC